MNDYQRDLIVALILEAKTQVSMAVQQLTYARGNQHDPDSAFSAYEAALEHYDAAIENLIQVIENEKGLR